jgi:hypothetical protein
MEDRRAGGLTALGGRYATGSRGESDWYPFEVWFGIIKRQAIHRGTFPSVRDLMIKIRTFINGWNDRCQPFTWTKTADQIPTHRQTTSDAVH